MDDTILNQLVRADACDRGLVFASKYNTPQEAWDACEEEMWLEWVLQHTLTKGQRFELAKRIAEGYQKQFPTLVIPQDDVGASIFIHQYGHGRTKSPECAYLRAVMCYRNSCIYMFNGMCYWMTADEIRAYVPNPPNQILEECFTCTS